MTLSVSNNNHDAARCGQGYFRCYTEPSPESLKLISDILKDDVIARNRVATKTDYDRMGGFFLSMHRVWETEQAVRTPRFDNLGKRVQLAADQAMLDWEQHELEKLRDKGKSVRAKVLEIKKLMSDMEDDWGIQKDPRAVLVARHDNWFYFE
ncbi:hypothetical protein N7523_005650 [Penicillium sp. IBT 18751x]|nr:hypothetical protein N7523_005650 [Penicillium sp. IBT 18751x]